MCGIAGYWGKTDEGVLEHMCASLAHRGPDAQGVYRKGDVGLAHTRLSILDLTQTGAQPMHTEDGLITIVFNGEVYNFDELRREHLTHVSFRGTSDTEVILYLYEKFGTACFAKLRGMFAIAIYDARTNELILARDQVGKKPLYWTQIGNTLIFGSEIKALLTHPACTRTIDADAVAQYLVFEYIPAPKTIFAGIHKLPQGTFLTFNGKDKIVTPYYTLNTEVPAFEDVFENAKDTLDRLLERAVQKRLVADVPVGVFLSGGIDSSTIAYYAQKLTHEQVRTFSIGFEDPQFDERSHAKAVAMHLGTKHEERVVTEKDLLESIKKLPQVLDEPMADSSILPTLLLSEFARKEVKVALGGDGADELFLGYGTFYAHKVAQLYERLPLKVRTMLADVSMHIPVSHGYMSFDFKLKRFLRGTTVNQKYRNTYWLSACTPEDLAKLLKAPTAPHMLSAVDAYYAPYQNFWHGVAHEYLSGYLVEDILVKVDRASMAHGLEVRSPFLDLDVLNFALSLKTEYKLHGRTGKFILKELIKERLPEGVVKRPKRGFNIPIGSWIKGNLKDFFTDTILDGELTKSGLFERSELAILLESHIGGREDNRKKIWALTMLELWLDTWHKTQ